MFHLYISDSGGGQNIVSPPTRNAGSRCQEMNNCKSTLFFFLLFPSRRSKGDLAVVLSISKERRRERERETRLCPETGGQGPQNNNNNQPRRSHRCGLTQVSCQSVPPPHNLPAINNDKQRRCRFVRPTHLLSLCEGGSRHTLPTSKYGLRGGGP